VDPAHSSLQVFARTVADELIATGKLDLTGKIIHNAAEAAVLFQVARNPRFETFHFVFPS
jgi:hypothetical protein